MSERPRSRARPRVFRADDPILRGAPPPGAHDDDPGAPPPAPPEPERRGSALAGLFWSALLGLLALAVSAAAFDLVARLSAAHPWLGRAALALIAVVLLGVVLFVLRELAALARLGRIDALRAAALRGWDRRDRAAAEEVRDGLDRLYRGRPELDAARARIRERAGDAPDADAFLTLLERETLTELDAAALAPVRRASRRVAAATALLPVGLLDAAAVLYFNTRMIREVALVYGGRAGWLGSWRLLKHVAVHLAATGAIAIGDDMLGAIVGGGALAQLSRRAGEGLVNGALTARIGVAAMEISRPMPFRALERPSVRSVAATALRGWGAAQPRTDA